MMTEKTYYAEYQPILDIEQNTVYGYEALARFQHRDELIPPNIVFEVLHHDLEKLTYIENEITNFQLEHRPEADRIFINYDPHSVIHGIGALRDCITRHSKNQGLVFELIEDNHELAPDVLHELTDVLSQTGIEMAVDDFAKTNSLFSFRLLGFCHYLKIDMEWVALAKSHQHYSDFLHAFIVFARSSKNHVIMEGITTKEELELARRLNVELVQGFLFQDQFISAHGSHG